MRIYYQVFDEKGICLETLSQFPTDEFDSLSDAKEFAMACKIQA